MPEKRYSKAVLSDEFANKMNVEKAIRRCSDTETERILNEIQQAVVEREALRVAELYRELGQYLSSGAEDEDLSTIGENHAMNQQKKMALEEVMNLCGVVAGYVYDGNDIGHRSSSRTHVFSETEIV